MARIVSQSIPRALLRQPRAIIGHRSFKTHRAQLIELDLDSSESVAEVINFEINRLEDAIQGMIVRRAAPSWLPFYPGISYWVPPRASSLRSHRSAGLIEVTGQLGSFGKSRNMGVTEELSEEQQMSLNSRKGWPSSDFFIGGTSPINPFIVVEMDVKVQDNDESIDGSSNPDDM